MRLYRQALFVVLLNSGALSIATADDSAPANPPIEDEPGSESPASSAEPDSQSEPAGESAEPKGESPTSESEQAEHTKQGSSATNKHDGHRHHKGNHTKGSQHHKNKAHSRARAEHTGHQSTEYGEVDETEQIGQAEVPKPTGIIPTASFFTRYELREGYDDIGRTHPRFRESDLMFYRARFGLTTTPNDIGGGTNVVLKFEAQASGFWADKGNTLNDGILGVHQATMRLSGKSYWFDAGRFEMVYGEHLVIGNVDWHQTGRTFDGLRTHVELDKGWVDLFLTQVAEDPTKVKPFASGDEYFSGIYAGLGPMLGSDIELDTYLLSKVVPRTSADTELGTQFTLGSRLKKKLGSSYVRAEAGLQVGAGQLDQLAFHGDAEAGTLLGSTKLAAGGWYASGDDPTTASNEGWDELFPTQHKFLGFADIIGARSNIMGGILRLRHPINSLSLGADTHFFLRPETPDGVDAFTAVELDTWALHKIGKGMGLRVGYSIFVPNESGPHQTSDLAHYVEVQLKYTLK